ncbi:MAG: hypothetical protein COB69_03035 [Phycisphaera sp.]|nr:MAG: hypothetical protein COB69_03035 [Phycisphaera sp.]
MPDRLFRLYQRKRIININANIVFSGLVSTAIVAGLLWLLKDIFHIHWPTWGYTAFSFGADLIFDVGMFAGLHWVANHWRPSHGRTAEEEAKLFAPAPNVVSDTTRLQFERAVISPLYYLIAIACTEYLQRSHGLHPAWAVAIAYPAGLVVTRTLHTIWGFRTGTYVDHYRRQSSDDRAQSGSD